jgi:hypothetical protein
MEVFSVQLKRKLLARLKREALRAGVWFSSLNEWQRRLMNLVIKVVKKVRSPFLAKLLAPILRTLLIALGRRFKASLRIVCRDAMEEEAIRGVLCLAGEAAYGMMKNVAEKISRIAHAWGNRLARNWSEDVGFLKYLTVMSLPQNGNPPMFTICGR